MVRWNAVFTSHEFSVLFSLGTKSLDVREVTVEPNELYGALEDIYRYASASVLTASDELALERAFSVAVSSKRLSEIRHSMQLARFSLAGADKLLTSRLPGRTLCFNGNPNQNLLYYKPFF
jgi:hypothetical protein